jgi:hypothetical protein
VTSIHMDSARKRRFMARRPTGDPARLRVHRARQKKGGIKNGGGGDANLNIVLTSCVRDRRTLPII